ncbi:MAG: glycosyltransferase family 39 protein [bacterium]|nr:glycosyltransferase family 39 protein [bacterium]
MKNKKFLLGILLAGLAVRLFLLVYFSEKPSFFLDDDSPGYLQLAENIKQGNGFSWESAAPYTPNSFRTPGYPFFLLLHRAITGNYRSALVTQILLVVATAYLIFLLAKNFGGYLWGTVAVGVFLFMPFSVMVSVRYLTQSLFVFSLLGVVWVWLQFLKTDHHRYLWITVVLLPTLALIRPIAFYVYLPFLVGYLWYRYRADQKINWTRFLIIAVLMVAVFFMVLSPWLIRNWFLFGHFSLASIPSYQLYFYDTPAVYAHNHGLSYAEARQFLEKDIEKYFRVARFEDYMTFEVSGVLADRAWHYLLESWPGLLITRAVLFLKFFVRDGIRYWGEFGLGGFLLELGALVERGVLSLLGLGTALFTWRVLRRRDFVSGAGGFLMILIAYFALLTGAVASAGLRFPVEPLIILVGLFGLTTLKSFKT